MSQSTVVGGGRPLPSGSSRSRLPRHVRSKSQRKQAQPCMKEIRAKTAAGVKQLEHEAHLAIQEIRAKTATAVEHLEDEARLRIREIAAKSPDLVRGHDENETKDHILLRWRHNLKVGDLVDARDPDNKWYESRVVEVDAEGDPELVTVHFLAWAAKWDKVFSRSSENLQRLHTFTKPWRQDLQVNSECEVLSSVNGTNNRWFKLMVKEVKFGHAKRLLRLEVPGVGSKWMPEDSEELCKVHTHWKSA